MRAVPTQFVIVPRAYSSNTIETYVKTITQKLGGVDRTQAAVYVAETGLFSPGFRVPEVSPRRA